MNTVRAIFCREIRAFLDSAAAYVIVSTFFLLAGFLFTSLFFPRQEASVGAFTDNAPLLLTFLVPALAMRLIAEENRSGTLEVLCTLPIREEEIILGKFLACWGMCLLCLASTSIFIATAAILGPLDWGQTIGAYLGLAAACGLFSAAALFASSLTRNQVIAFILAATFCFLLFLVGKAISFLPAWAARVLDPISLDAHLESPMRGVLEIRDFFYFVGGIAVFLWAAVVSLTFQRYQ